MKKLFYLILITTLFPLISLCSERKNIVITNVKTIDPIEGKLELVKAVLISEGKIKKIFSKEEYSVPPETVVINGEGKFLTPGLIDCHVHISGSAGSNVTRTEFLESTFHRNLLGYLASGVTTIRDLCCPPEFIGQLRRESDAGKILAPDIIMAGPAFTAPGGHPAKMFSRIPGLAESACRLVTNEDEARQMVIELKDRVDVIKAIYDDLHGSVNQLDYNLLKAIVDETHKQGMEITVHTGNSYRFFKDIVLSGADGVEHSCLENVDIEDEVIKKMIHNAVIYDPTLVVMKNYEDIFSGEPEPEFDKWTLQRVNRNIVRSLKSPNAWWKQPQEMDIDKHILSFEYGKENLLKLYRKGVKIAVGTDAGNPFTFHGASLMEELKYMKEAGLTEKEIIYCAYITSAEAVGLKDEIGQIKEGFRASLLLLSENPLDDINNFKNIDHLILRGKILNMEKLLKAINPENKRYKPKSDMVDDFEDNNRMSNFGGKWDSITDFIMGGESTIDLSFEGGAMKMSGFVSPKAGFTSFAGATANFFDSDYEAYDLSKYSGIILKVKGDGKYYRINLCSQKVIDFDDFFATFKTEENQYTEIQIPFSKFKQFGFGEQVKWDRSDIYGISILTFGNANKNFNLEIDEIRFY